MNDHTTTIQLDIAHEGTLPEALAALEAAVPGLACTLLEAQGPAGWPLVECTLPTSSMPALAEAYGADLDELEGWAC